MSAHKSYESLQHTSKITMGAERMTKNEGEYNQLDNHRSRYLGYRWRLETIFAEKKIDLVKTREISVVAGHSAVAHNRRITGREEMELR
jgi:hypothetical protein